MIYGLEQGNCLSAERLNTEKKSQLCGTSGQQRSVNKDFAY